MGVKSLRLDGCSVGLPEIRRIAEGMVASESLRTFACDETNIEVGRVLWTGPEAAGEFRPDHALTIIDWTGIGFDMCKNDDMVTVTLGVLLNSEKCRLEVLKISVRQLSMRSAAILADGVFHSRLVDFYISTKFPLENFREDKFDEIDWSNRKITSMDVAILCRFLDDNTSVRKLRLNDNELDYRGIRRLCETLEKSETIRLLHIGANKWDDASTIAIGDMLAKNTSLHKLDIRCTDLTDVDVKGFRDGLLRNKTLKIFDVGWNQISDEGVMTMVSVLATNTTLREVNMEQNAITQNLKPMLKSHGIPNALRI